MTKAIAPNSLQGKVRDLEKVEARFKGSAERLAVKLEKADEEHTARKDKIQAEANDELAKMDAEIQQLREDIRGLLA